MSDPISRRDVFKVAAVGGLAALPGLPSVSNAAAPPGWVTGHKSGARALVETLQAEGTLCVFGIPGAQENELWDEFKACHLPYLLVTHEFSASCMADGAARATGRPGVVCVVPGPGITNAMTGIGEALLDSVPLVVIAGDVARGKKHIPFQVHELPNTALLSPVCKEVIEVGHVSQIPTAVRQAFQIAQCGEPGPVGVVIPYTLLIDMHKFNSAPLAPVGLPGDDCAIQKAVTLLSDRRLRVGIYAGLGCLNHSAALVRAAELLQAPVATSVSGKGSVPECHPLAVGWGYGPQGTRCAEHAFKHVDVVLAVGVRFSEVSTGFYSLPDHRHLIHVDASAANLGKVMKADVCVHADAGVFLSRLLEAGPQLARPENNHLVSLVSHWRTQDARAHQKPYARCGVDPMAFLLALRRSSCAETLVFVDVTLSEHLAAEAFTTTLPRTYFNPTDNQSMGWSIPAALGAQRVCPGRTVVTVTGDGCFLMSAMELATAAREGLPVKFFVLDDRAYHYMQVLQNSAYRRTTATHLPRIDYAAFAQGLGVAHVAIRGGDNLDAQIQGVLNMAGPVLVNVVCDYGERPIRWISAVRRRYTEELSTSQKARFLARISARTLNRHPDND